MMQRRSLVGLAAVPLLGRMAPGRAQVAHLADAVNKAGRQRMLSQRLAKAWLAQGLGVELPRAQRVMAESTALFERQLQELRDFAPTSAIADTYRALGAAWSGYREALDKLNPSASQAPALMRLDAEVLALAHQGTNLLEAEAGKPVARLVNLAGRQRMLSQRLAKFFLARLWKAEVPDAASQMALAEREFTAAMTVLSTAPEATDAIGREIELGRQQWIFYANALARIDTGMAQPRHGSEVFLASENLLQVMDRTTGLYARLGAA